MNLNFILEFESKEVTSVLEKTGTNTFYFKTEKGIAELNRVII